jgi:hypothetical protein
VLNADKRPYSIAFAKLWVPKTKVLGGNLGLSLVSSDVFSWAHGEVTGLINFEDTVQGWGFGDTTARAQLGWNSGPLSNTLYLTTWFPTGRYQRGFSPNTGKNHYGRQSWVGLYLLRAPYEARIRFGRRRDLQRRKSGNGLQGRATTSSGTGPSAKDSPTG